MIKCFMVVPTGQTIDRLDIKDDTGKVIGSHIDMLEYRREDTGEAKFDYPWTFGPGAMWLRKYDNYSDYGLDYFWTNEEPEGRLMVVLPNGHHWDIDSRCSNCTMKEERTHRCWVRHGVPPNITVDKAGYTCKAGAGSILSDKYHGFLRNGFLTDSL